MEEDDEETSAFPAFACVAVAPTAVATSGTMYDVLMDTYEDTGECDIDVPDAPDAQCNMPDEPMLPEPTSPAPGIRDLPADVPLCPWTDSNVDLYEPPVDGGPPNWEWDWIRAE